MWPVSRYKVCIDVEVLQKTVTKLKNSFLPEIQARLLMNTGHTTVLFYSIQ